MADLETRLRALADEAAWPPTPDLAGNVAAALAARHEAAVAPRPRRGLRRRAPAAPPGAGTVAPRRRRRMPRRALAAAAAVLVLVPAAGAAAFPGARNDVLEWLGLRHTEVRRTPTPPPPAPAPTGLDLGRRTTLAEAARQVGFVPLVPAGLGAPDAVRVARLGAATRVTLVYRPRRALPALRGARAGLLVTQVRGSLEGNLLRKVAGPGTVIRRVRVDGHDGLVFSGAPHVYLYLDPAGQILEDRPWLAGNTLVLERDDAVIRLEAAAPPSALERLATTLRVSRPAP